MTQKEVDKILTKWRYQRDAFGIDENRWIKVGNPVRARLMLARGAIAEINAAHTACGVYNVPE